MSLSDDVKTAMTSNTALMAVLTGGVFNDVEEISRQLTPGAFDANLEIKPCALIKMGTESKTGPYVRSVNSPLTIYFYQRSGYASIESAMDKTFDLLNEKQIGSGVWELTYDVGVHQQRDVALDCPLGSLRFVAVRHR